jgi:undecaprenyldiphospho-muramoylpentapeptide beta-N-acetylglucosaminyltransferase
MAVLQTLLDKAETLWVGGEGGMETRLVERVNVPFKTIPAAGLHGVGFKTLPGNIVRLIKGYFASRRILKDYKPDVLFFTGGYIAVPMVLAGWRIPTVLYVPDVEPALALRTVARFADRIAVTEDASFQYFTHPERLVLTGYPTRADLADWNREKARQTLSLDEHQPVVLVLGGSKGARSINNAVLDNLPALLKKVQVVHVTGELDWPGVEARISQLSKAQMVRYQAYPYLHEQMGAALAAADLVVSRAGASSLGEFPLFSLPAILVPYPHAWRYQKVNAGYLVQAGAAVMLEDASLSERLYATISELLGNPQKLNSMREAMQRQSHPQAAKKIGSLLLSLAGERR